MENSFVLNLKGKEYSTVLLSGLPAGWFPQGNSTTPAISEASKVD